MGEVSRTEEGFVVDAAVIGRAFSIPSEQVRDEMRGGQITSRSETGTDEDTGRWRMTFFRNGRAFRLVVDADGQILSRSKFPVQVPPPGA